MKTPNILEEKEIKEIVDKQLIKKDKLISRMQINAVIQQEVLIHLKVVYKEMDKLRTRMLELENKSEALDKKGL